MIVCCPLINRPSRVYPISRMPKLALVWSTRHDLTTKALYGRAFRAPSFGEQQAQNNPITLGNPNLEPETLSAYELVFDYRPSGTLSGRLNLFRYNIDDLIEVTERRD